MNENYNIKKDNIKKNIKAIMMINIICYTCNYAYITVNYKYELIRELSFRLMMIMLFLTITSFILESEYHKERLYIRKYAIIDYIIRAIGLIISFMPIEINYGVRVIVIIILFVTNFCIELFMYNKKVVFPICSNEEELSGKEKYRVNINNGAVCSTIGTGTILFVASIFGVIQGNWNRNKLLLIIISIATIILCGVLEYKKITKYYVDRNVVKKLLIKNIGIMLCGEIIWIIQRIYFQQLIWKNVGTLIVILSFIPSINTTRRIGIEFKKYNDQRNNFL